MCEKFIFEIHFEHCDLSYAKFYALQLAKTHFSNCELIAVDFMQANLTQAIFLNCDLFRAEFAKANLTQADLSSSFNYTIHPSSTKIKKAHFSLSGAQGLLHHHDIKIIEGK